MKPDLVSICIPTYNGAQFFQQALDSVHRQTYRNFEVIISDDASTDETLIIAENFCENASFPVFIYNHQPAGIGANWDHCIEKANGKWIKFLFQDDILEENCLEEFIRVQKFTGEHVFFCKRTLIDEQGRDISGGSHIADLQQGLLPDFSDHYILSRKDLKYLQHTGNWQLSHNFLGEPVASFISKEAFARIGSHSDTLKQLLDLDYNLRLVAHFRIVITSKKLVRFRIHEDQATHQNWLNNVNEHRQLNELILKKHFRFLSIQAILGYFYSKYPLLKYVRGKVPF